MEEQNWIKYGAIGLAAVGFLLLIGFALGDSGDLEGRSWSVTEMSLEGATAPPIEGTTMTATFEDGTVGGIATCNNYFGSYEAKRGSLTIGPLGTTLMACIGVPGSDVQEQTYLALLQSAEKYSVDGDTLEISSGGSVVLKYVELTVEHTG